jgi:predicted Zn finger-like uncharacterized protein
MLIVCPSCASEYTVDPAKLGADGRTVRCAICRDTWFVRSSPEAGLEPEPAQADLPDEPGVGPIPLQSAAAPEAAAASSRSRGRTRPARLAGLLTLAVVGLATLTIGSGSGFLDRIEQVLAKAAPRREVRPAFGALSSDLIDRDGTMILVVRGEIANPTRQEIALADLEILVRNGDEHVLTTFTEPPPRPTLGPGEAVSFRAELVSPPPDARQVRVQFAKGHGVAAASRPPPL